MKIHLAWCCQIKTNPDLGKILFEKITVRGFPHCNGEICEHLQS